jgi:hypothetical protein
VRMVDSGSCDQRESSALLWTDVWPYMEADFNQELREHLQSI